VILRCVVAPTTRRVRLHHLRYRGGDRFLAHDFTQRFQLPELLYEISTRPVSVNNAATAAPSRASTTSAHTFREHLLYRSFLSHFLFSPLLSLWGASLSM
jgi:hypothetical protein